MVVGRVKVKGGADADIVVGSSDQAQLRPHEDYKNPNGPGAVPGPSSSSFGPTPTGPGLLNYGSSSSAPPPTYGSREGQSLGGTNAQGQYPPEKSDAHLYR
jgi:hypothetical protein